MRARIFVERNFGNGQGQAFPPLGFWRKWLDRLLVSKAGMSRDRLTIKWRHLIFRDVKADGECADPRARNPQILMTVIMPDTLDFNCGKFDEFLEQCWGLARGVKTPGEDKGLLVEIPKQLLPVVSKGRNS